MTETLLNAAASIDRAPLERFLNLNRRVFQEVQRLFPAVNNACSICLLEFERGDQCVVVPSCQHCFHEECIGEWLGTKSTCPYCRHNIQLDIVLDNE
jgi:hypothetical protein